VRACIVVCRGVSREGDVLVSVNNKSTTVVKQFPKILQFLNECVRAFAFARTAVLSLH
jgi:hypothetical protein